MQEAFAFLFKYRPFFFQTGDFSFQTPLPLWAWLLILVALPVGLYWIYRKGWFSDISGRTGWWLIGLRTAFFVLLALLLCRPSLVLSTLQPKESLLAILVDNSRSMGLTDGARGPRGQPVVGLLGGDSEFLQALDEKFYLRLYQFDSSTRRTDEGLELEWSGDQTNIGAGLEAILGETKNLPLAGVVLLTDGADTSSRNFSEVLSELKARKIPVHTVGVGPDSLQQDVEIVQVSAPRALLPETVSSARVTIRQRGFAGSRARLEVREGNSLVESKEVHFPRGTESFNTEVTIRPRTEGLKNYQFRLQPLQGEALSENNVRTALVEVKDSRPRVLYVEGHPRWEFKFIRRALSGDKHVRLETLLRTALNKFYRQGIEEETTLASGFPSTREELFQYQAVMLGSLESSFFSYGQMDLVRDFVGQRGGGFLMMGGSKSFQSGKYRNTPIEDVLPVWLQEESDNAVLSASLYNQDDVFPRLSQFGENHAALQLSLSSQENRAKWDSLPFLRDWNRIESLKPGAVTLIQLDIPGAGRRGSKIPLMAHQRFGRGQGLAFMSGTTWFWQMRQEFEDQSHETFWRQLMRWLVNTAKAPVTVETERETYSSREPVQIRAEVRDQAYRAINDARAEVSVTTPSGNRISLPLQWDSREDGVYRGTFIPEEDGLHQLSVQAENRASDDQPYGSAQSYFVTAAGQREYFDPVLKSDFLRKLAQETGGSYRPLAEAELLPEEIVYTPSTASVVEVRELWDMPFNLLLLLSFLGAEWILRKKGGGI